MINNVFYTTLQLSELKGTHAQLRARFLDEEQTFFAMTKP